MYESREWYLLGICLVLEASVMENRVISLSCLWRMMRKCVTKYLFLLDDPRQ